MIENTEINKGYYEMIKFTPYHAAVVYEQNSVN